MQCMKSSYTTLIIFHASQYMNSKFLSHLDELKHEQYELLSRLELKQQEAAICFAILKLFPSLFISQPVCLNCFY